MKKFYKFLDKVGAALLGLFFATFIVWFTGTMIFVMWDLGFITEIVFPLLKLAGVVILPIALFGEGGIALLAIMFFVLSGM